MARIIFLFCSFVFLFQGCNSRNPLRPENGTVLVVETYELSLSDTSNIFRTENNSLIIDSFRDSLLTRIDTVYFKVPTEEIDEDISGRIDQVVINSCNRNTFELYRFENDKIYLAGYMTDGMEKKYTVFDPPLVILIPIDEKIDSIKSMMKNYSGENKTPGKEKAVKSLIRLIRKGKITIAGVEEEYYRYELTISQDESIQFGENNLVVPEAVILTSNVLYGNSSGIIAEWGLRTKQKNDTGNVTENKIAAYLEFNKYFNKQK
ncbi:MAG: hypothetical protein V1720_19605 [bacterium]